MKSSSRSVTSSSRVDRDDDGKRVVTTVTKTTIVDSGGKRKTETVTTRRHVDDGGRVETERVADDDGRRRGAPPRTPSTGDSPPAAAAGGGSNGRKDGSAVDDATTTATTTTTTTTAGGRRPPPHDDRRGPMFPPAFPFYRPAMIAPPRVVAVVEKPPTSPPKVAAIATDCLLGVSVADAASSDPDGGKRIGWRKTEYLFKLSRFVPPFMIVGKYYKDEEEEERRRKEMQKEYDDMLSRLRRNRWDSATKRYADSSSSAAISPDEKKKEGMGSADSEKDRKATDLPRTDNVVSSRTEYYLQRTYVQMAKNANMMTHTVTDVMMKPDFPKKVQAGGERILDNIRPTAERTGKLMRDVWDMWVGWANGR
jgi:hypothetical protein